MHFTIYTYLIIYKDDVSLNHRYVFCTIGPQTASTITIILKQQLKAVILIQTVRCQIQQNVSNNGSNVGDPLCCGQSGVRQDTKYNCPSETPICVGYKWPNMG